MDEIISGFDWDQANRQKCQKHGVSITEIVAILINDPVIAPDLRHMASEDRYIAVGRNNHGRPVFVAFTIRARAGQRRIRPVRALRI